jgi:hypothetical protein
LTIALLRGATLGLLPPAVVMMTITFAAVMISAWAVYRLIEISGAGKDRALQGACLYGLWPCVGLTVAVFPYADDSALALLLTGLLALQCSHPRKAAALFGLAAVFHKSTWLFTALLIVADIYRGKGKSWRDPLALAFLGLPLIAVWLLGTWHYGSPAWMLATSLGVGSEMRASWPILDGIVGAVSAGGMKAVVKGGLVVGLALTAVVSLYASLRSKQPNRACGIAISLGCLFFFIFLTRPEIWAAVRFSKLLVLPLAWSMAERPIKRSPLWLGIFIVVLLVLLASQFALMWYSARVFYGHGR